MKPPSSFKRSSPLALSFLQTYTEKKEQHCRLLFSGFKPESA